MPAGPQGRGRQLAAPLHSRCPLPLCPLQQPSGTGEGQHDPDGKCRETGGEPGNRRDHLAGKEHQKGSGQGDLLADRRIACRRTGVFRLPGRDNPLSGWNFGRCVKSLHLFAGGLGGLASRSSRRMGRIKAKDRRFRRQASRNSRAGRLGSAPSPRNMRHARRPFGQNLAFTSRADQSRMEHGHHRRVAVAARTPHAAGSGAPEDTKLQHNVLIRQSNPPPSTSHGPTALARITLDHGRAPHRCRRPAFRHPGTDTRPGKPASATPDHLPKGRIPANPHIQPIPPVRPTPSPLPSPGQSPPISANSILPRPPGNA